MDAAKAEDVRALGEIACFVGSRGTRTKANNTTRIDLTATPRKWRSIAHEFIRTTTDADSDSRPDSDVVIYHPFLFLGCQEVRQQFVSFLASHQTKPDVLKRMRTQMESWLKMIPADVNQYKGNEDIGDLEDLINQICQTNLENYKELTLIVLSAYRTAPFLFSNFIWKILVSLCEKVLDIKVVTYTQIIVIHIWPIFCSQR